MSLDLGASRPAILWAAFSVSLAIADWGPRVLFQSCSSDVYLGGATDLARKGMTLDDTTMRYCSSRIPSLWPNTQEPLQSLRLVRAWDPTWPEESRAPSFQALAEVVKANGMKVLVGAAVTCSDEDDARAWDWSKELLTLLGPAHVMGVSIGNELDLLYQHVSDTVSAGVPQSCIEELWEGPSGGNFWRKFTSWVAELDSLHDGFKTIPVTSVFTGAALGGNPFLEIPGKSQVNTFMVRASQKYGHRFSFTFNIYPYFDPSYRLDWGSTCANAMSTATCWKPTCNVDMTIVAARRKVRQLTGQKGDLLWVGESGWSSPKSRTLHTAMARCATWSTAAALQEYYKGFLNWDLQLYGARPPDHIFYYTLRDSLNFGFLEHFGLIESCESEVCKLRSDEYTVIDQNRSASLSWVRWAYAGIGGVLVLAFITTCIQVRAPAAPCAKGDDDGATSDSS
ncbi:unnamed protein product [Polarella glacialis]|uniref:Uncharacterized protein n=1 Tax=Polarella glacialis TaxID=89957 RepID=A0A813FR60_POLGL|nr:unnamed protein product [Polarella glacialis]